MKTLFTMADFYGAKFGTKSDTDYGNLPEKQEEKTADNAQYVLLTVLAILVVVRVVYEVS